jgi:hypothetical protein
MRFRNRGRRRRGVQHGRALRRVPWVVRRRTDQEVVATVPVHADIARDGRPEHRPRGHSGQADAALAQQPEVHAVRGRAPEHQVRRTGRELAERIGAWGSYQQARPDAAARVAAAGKAASSPIAARRALDDGAGGCKRDDAAAARRRHHMHRARTTASLHRCPGRTDREVA